MFKTANIAGATAAVLSSFAIGSFAIPTAASADVIGCDASGGRQEAGAVIGGVLGGVLGNRLAGRRNRTVGTVVGAGAGAAAGSYVGCRQQEERARTEQQRYADNRGDYSATRNVRVRSGPGTHYQQIGSISAGDRFDVSRSQYGWSQINGGGWINTDYIARN